VHLLNDLRYYRCLSAPYAIQACQPNGHKIIQLVNAATVHLNYQIMCSEAQSDVADLRKACNLVSHSADAIKLDLDPDKTDHSETHAPWVNHRGETHDSLRSEAINPLADGCFMGVEFARDLAVARTSIPLKTADDRQIEFIQVCAHQ
jgi:hypothetical protein